MTTISRQTIAFLRQLKQNNNKEWFDANRKEAYEAAKQNFLQFINSLIENIIKFDEDISGLEVKETLFRINRDIRFSKDKSPYKTNFGSSINKGGKKSITAGYYLHMEPGNKSFAAGGSWQPQPEQLNAIRQEIDYNFADFKKIISVTSFKSRLEFEEADKLKTVPKGYASDNAAIDYFKYRSFIVSKMYPDSEVISDNFLNDLTSTFKAMKPFISFLNRAIK